MYEKIMVGQVNWPKNIDHVAKDLLKSILIVDPNLRASIDDIKEHRFFKEIDWELARNRDLPPSVIPDLRDNFDTSNFKEFRESLLDGADKEKRHVKPLGDYRMYKLNNVFEDF